MRRMAGTVLGFVLAGCGPALAADVSIAVAANFTAVAEELATDFKSRTGDNLVLSFGATGALYAQVTQGAPFEVFLSADSKRPALAVADGFGVAGTVFTYAIGKLVLYSPTLDVTAGEAVLRAGAFSHIAIADPASAPYGAAAVEALTALGLHEALASRLVTGENISQTLQFVESGNAELGFVALSQVIGRPGYQWAVPAELYTPIRQDAVLLQPGEANPAARAFVDYLRSEAAVAIIEQHGYSVK
jgi:molybdate transport system substrate-binding protein